MGLLSAFMWFANNAWWPTWSNLRWAKENKISIALKSEHRVRTLAQVKALACKMYNSSNYTYKSDGFDQLFDSICPPQYNYKRWLAGNLKDDCDGFAALMLFCLHESGIKSCLLSVCEKKDGHCVNLFKLGSLWYIIDYSTVYGGWSSAATAIKEYNKTYIKKYNNGKGSVVFNSVINYNFKQKRYVAGSIAQLDKGLAVYWNSLGF